MSDHWRTSERRARAVARAFSFEETNRARAELGRLFGRKLPKRSILLDPCGQEDQHVDAAVVVVAGRRALRARRGSALVLRGCGLEILEQLWSEGLAPTVYANVPYSEAAVWARALARHSGPTLMMAPAAPGALYWRTSVWPEAEVGFLGREAFVDHLGTEQPGSRIEHALVAWRCSQPRLAAPEAVWVRAAQALQRRAPAGRGGHDTPRARGRQGLIRERLLRGERLDADALAAEFQISRSAAQRALQRARR